MSAVFTCVFYFLVIFVTSPIHQEQHSRFLICSRFVLRQSKVRFLLDFVKSIEYKKMFAFFGISGFLQPDLHLTEAISDQKIAATSFRGLLGGPLIM